MGVNSPRRLDKVVAQGGGGLLHFRKLFERQARGLDQVHRQATHIMAMKKLRYAVLSLLSGAAHALRSPWQCVCLVSRQVVM